MKYFKRSAGGLFVAAAAALAPCAFAHPVTYDGAVGIMGEYTPGEFMQEVSFTSGSRSIGILEYLVTNGSEHPNFIIPRLSYRFRENSLDSQSNLYLLGGLGARTDKSDEKLAGYTGLQADYETRRFYTQATAETIIDGSSDPFTKYRARAGLAPYKAGYSDLASWLILQATYEPNNGDDTFSVAPVLRLFYSNYLLEAGASFDGDLFISWMMTF